MERKHRSSPVERLQRLVSNIQLHSPNVDHPDKIKGCMFQVGRPMPQNTWGSPDLRMPNMDLLAGWISPHSQPYCVDWDGKTGRKLRQIEQIYGEHWSIDFCLDAWTAWQAGDWDQATT